MWLSKPGSVETFPALSLFLFRRIFNRDIPGADAQMMICVRPRNATGPVLRSFKNNRIPINPADRPSRSGAGQGVVQPLLSEKRIEQGLSR
jgi:hypothetical protein